MTAHIIQIERWNDTGWAFLRVRSDDTPDKDVLRPLDPRIFDETPLPAEHRVRAGALVALLLGYAQRSVLSVEIRWFDDGDLWTAEAQIDDGDQIVYRRGVGATPVDALVALSVDIHDY